MATSSTLKALKEKDEPLVPRDMPVAVRSGGLGARLNTLWRSIWRRRWLSMSIAWLICLAGWAAITLWPTSFVASTVVYADLHELADLETGPQDQTPTATLKALLLSENGLTDIQRQVELAPERARSLQDDIVIRSTVPPVFIVTYEHERPDVAKQVLDILITGFRTRLDEVSAASLDARNELERQIADQEGRLQTVASDLKAFRRINANYLNGTDVKTAELALLDEEIASLDALVQETIAERDDIAAKLANVETAEAEATAAELEMSLDQLDAERAALDAELAKLRERYADTHPYVIAVFETISELDAEAEALAASPNAEVAAGEPLIDRGELEQRHGELIVEVSTLSERLGGKRREIDALQTLTRTTTSVEAELAGLDAEKEKLEAALSDLEQRRDELDGGRTGKAEQAAFQLIKQPERPTDPVGPSRLMALAAVLLGGTGLGTAVAVCCNRLMGVFESAWQLKQRFDVGVLGTISEVMTPVERKRLGYARLGFGLACLALIGTFSGLMIAELTDRLAPLGDHLRAQILG